MELAAAVFLLETVPRTEAGRSLATRGGRKWHSCGTGWAGTAPPSGVGWEYGVFARTGVKRAKPHCRREGAQSEKSLGNSVRLPSTIVAMA